MFVLLMMVAVVCFSVYLSIEAMKNGMCEKRWFVAGMCFGPVVWPMFNVKKQMLLRKQQGIDGVSLRL
ncbi:hypothetical protein KO525_17405 [Psychrosphaera sp. B3R10]|uniref:Uncharacterized protein n=1 Tax=Psychrosphaera algicola TaxID=3023714 RepID=A0ABT5FI56_9GAMM|nr:MULTISPECIES: hypothetical protein [unclassified Psychrosphaera]MBU2881587.1 hypothetical protein [Psychrosphaera sp. I2R16]MBU2991158.1 hypothetical protein [Psychrosphaera sp. B3R10]MDC2890879.1 hypothetical protein [Psychrosphaera sp. G1-22]MDO6719511.1 hypothetical protein [Psychrosphaera sp. 1_MG-2023]